MLYLLLLYYLQNILSLIFELGFNSFWYYKPALTNLIEFDHINLTNWSNITYIKNSVEPGIMLLFPFVFNFDLVYTNYITPLQSNRSCKNDLDNITQNSSKFFDELVCRPECCSMRVCSAQLTMELVTPPLHNILA